MNHSSISPGADDVLDFNDIVLITMSSSTTSGRVLAASTCACGNLDVPAGRDERAQPAVAASVGARLRRGFIAALKSLRVS
jgi:hypothetical protein